MPTGMVISLMLTQLDNEKLDNDNYMARLTGIQRILEVGMMISCCLRVFSYFWLWPHFDPADPSWSSGRFAGRHSIIGWGPIGAWFADILFFAFGTFAYVLPFASAFCRLVFVSANQSASPSLII